MTLFEPDLGSDGTGASDRPEEGPRVRLRLDVAYRGSGFAGFAAQPGQRTVAGALARALGRPGSPVRLGCAGRTDAGVHAEGQVVHVDLPVDSPAEGFDPAALQRRLNRQLAPAIVVVGVREVDDRFDARRCATGRRYRYRIRNAPWPAPLTAETEWWVKEPLDLAAMRLAIDPLLGEHDFSAFCRRPGDGGSLRRRVLSATWRREEPTGLVFEIAAQAFCHQMVRSIVALMVKVGRHRLRAGEVAGVLAAGEREAVGSPAPPQGLVLAEVTYPPGCGDRPCRAARCRAVEPAETTSPAPTGGEASPA